MSEKEGRRISAYIAAENPRKKASESAQKGRKTIIREKGSEIFPKRKGVDYPRERV
jgi:hypothetical protein